jgi:hypothetical protein
MSCLLDLKANLNLGLLGLGQMSVNLEGLLFLSSLLQVFIIKSWVASLRDFAIPRKPGI